MMVAILRRLPCFQLPSCLTWSHAVWQGLGIFAVVDMPFAAPEFPAKHAKGGFRRRSESKHDMNVHHMPKTNTLGQCLKRALMAMAAVCLLINMLAAADGGAATAPVKQEKIHALIVTGVDYPGHPWAQTTPVLRRQLEKDARFVVRVVEDPHFLDSNAINAYDLVVLNFMNWEVPAPGEQARRHLREFVSGGKGLVLVHFSCGAWQDWPEFVELAGRVWDPKLRPHDPLGRFTVTPSAGNHPITAGMKPFETTDELYTCLAGNTPVEILATARSIVDQKDYPMAFVLNYGKGRVFHSPLGHDARALDNDAVGALFRQGAVWAAGQPERLIP